MALITVCSDDLEISYDIELSSTSPFAGVDMRAWELCSRVVEDGVIPLYEPVLPSSDGYPSPRRRLASGEV